MLRIVENPTVRAMSVSWFVAITDMTVPVERSWIGPFNTSIEAEGWVASYEREFGRLSYSIAPLTSPDRATEETARALTHGNQAMREARADRDAAQCMGIPVYAVGDGVAPRTRSLESIADTSLWLGWLTHDTTSDSPLRAAPRR